MVQVRNLHCKIIPLLICNVLNIKDIIVYTLIYFKNQKFCSIR